MAAMIQRSIPRKHFSRQAPRTYHRYFASPSALQSKPQQIDVSALLSTHSWSMASFLLPETLSIKAPQISPAQLTHLLRLSALPPPSSPEEEAKMLAALSSHLHFVKAIQSVDTTGIKPLKSLRDETKAGEEEAELGMEALEEALGKEGVQGRFHRRVRRARDEEEGRVEGVWDPVETARRKVGAYFVVEGGKGRGS